MQTIELRQTTENNGGPCNLKIICYRGTLYVKKWRQVVLTKRQYVTSWEWERVAYLCLQQYSATEVRWLFRICAASSLGSEASQTIGL